MHNVFQRRGFFKVPTAQKLDPFLNATDVSQDDVPWNALGDLSIASGRIGPHVHSSVHMHPVVTQVTYVVSGSLTVRMMEPGAQEVYELSVRDGDRCLQLLATSAKATDTRLRPERVPWPGRGHRPAAPVRLPL